VKLPLHAAFSSACGGRFARRSRIWRHFAREMRTPGRCRALWLRPTSSRECTLSAAAGIASADGSRSVHVTVCAHRARCDGLDRVLRSDSGQGFSPASHRSPPAAPQVGHVATLLDGICIRGLCESRTRGDLSQRIAGRARKPTAFQGVSGACLSIPRGRDRGRITSGEVEANNARKEIFQVPAGWLGEGCLRRCAAWP
jgi:hypothetical protein